MYLLYLLYTLLTLVFFVAASPWVLYQGLRRGQYVGTLRQRFGYLPVSFNPDGDEAVWIHAVSVGEALTARPLLAELRRRYPKLRLVVSTTTLAGQQVARQNLQGVDEVFYFPFDLGFSVRRILRLVRPRLFLMMETEIWPNLLRACRRSGVKTVMVNGRVSDRSYPRYRLIRPFFRRVLDDVDRFCVQGEESRRRLLDLGAAPARMTVTGSLKFDSLPSARQARHGDRVVRFFRVAPSRPVVIAGSTMRGEETHVLDAFGAVRGVDQSLLILAPRHPERFAEVERMAKDAGFDTVRRSELEIDKEPCAEVVVLDSIGELAQLYQVATLVFVGGSLVETGGHNILEPAAFGKPIVFGPHMHNFAEIAGVFLSNGAAVQVASGNELGVVLRRLLHDPAERARLGGAARTLVDANRGAKDKTMAVIGELLPEAPVVPAKGRRALRVLH
jgi:3-deoxy-D-manno-octulosonic-acid transferase